MTVRLRLLCCEPRIMCHVKVNIPGVCQRKHVITIYLIHNLIRENHEDCLSSNFLLRSVAIGFLQSECNLGPAPAPCAWSLTHNHHTTSVARVNGTEIAANNHAFDDTIILIDPSAPCSWLTNCVEKKFCGCVSKRRVTLLDTARWTDRYHGRW